MRLLVSSTENKNATHKRSPLLFFSPPHPRTRIASCRSKSEFLRERQAATTMEVDQAYVVGQCDKRAEDDGYVCSERSSLNKKLLQKSRGQRIKQFSKRVSYDMYERLL